MSSSRRRAPDADEKALQRRADARRRRRELERRSPSYSPEIEYVLPYPPPGYPGPMYPPPPPGAHPPGPPSMLYGPPPPHPPPFQHPAPHPPPMQLMHQMPPPPGQTQLQVIHQPQGPPPPQTQYVVQGPQYVPMNGYGPSAPSVQYQMVSPTQQYNQTGQYDQYGQVQSAPPFQVGQQPGTMVISQAQAPYQTQQVVEYRTEPQYAPAQGPFQQVMQHHSMPSGAPQMQPHVEYISVQDYHQRQYVEGHRQMVWRG